MDFRMIQFLSGKQFAATTWSFDSEFCRVQQKKFFEENLAATFGMVFKFYFFNPICILK